jgi:Tol biopolymer transport system component
MQVTVPHWSPDATRIAFSGASPGDPYRVYLISASGGTPEQLTSGKGDLDPSWSNDGSKIMFGVLPPVDSSEQAKIMVLDLKTHSAAQLTGSDGICCPRWSPDGKWVIGLDTGNHKLFLFDASTQKWRELADNMGTIGYMTWSSDSKSFGFDTSLTTDPGYFRVTPGDGKVTRIFSLKNIHRFFPQWGEWSGLAPDGSPLIVRDISTQEIYALDWKVP